MTMTRAAGVGEADEASLHRQSRPSEEDLMRRSTRVLTGLAALALPVGTVLGFAVPGASAQPQAPVVATGTLSCTGAAGHVKFDPPLTSTATDTSDNVTINVNVHGCTATGGNVTSTGFTGHAKGTVTISSDNCSAFSGPISVSGSLTVRWTAKAGTVRVATSTLSPTAVAGLVTGTLNGNPGLSFTGQPVTGSFAGTGSGEFDAAQSALALLGKCAGHGVRGISVNAGSVSQP